MTEGECRPSLTQKGRIREILELTGGRIVAWYTHKVGFLGPGKCQARVDIYERTVNLDIDWLDYNTAFEIISLLVNRRDN